MNIIDLQFIAVNMRAKDRAEIYGMRWDDDPDKVASETFYAVKSCGTGRIFYLGNEPVSVVGGIERHPGVWYAFAYGTDKWNKVAKSLSAYAKSELAPYLFERAHRIECQSRYDHGTSHRWLEWLGAHRESVLAGFGKDGADYFNYVWIRK